MGISHHGRTARLDPTDPTLREWECNVVGVDPERGIVLDRSAFYPGGGGQPPDHGVLLWQGVQTRIIGTLKGDDLYLVPAEGDPAPPVGTAVTGAVEDGRRTMLMRTHSGLHVLGGVVFRDFGALVTGGNMEPGEARMDFNLPEVPEGFKALVEERVNAEIETDRRVDIRVLSRDEALAIPDIIRTQTNLIPPEEAEVRIVDITGLDVQADGGTHVASTRQIGRLQVVKVENKGRQNRRVRVRLVDLAAGSCRSMRGPFVMPVTATAPAAGTGGPVRFLFLLYGDPAGEAALSPDERRAVVDGHLALGRELGAAGRLHAAEALGGGVRVL